MIERQRALCGGVASLRNVPLCKGLAQMLLDMPIVVPEVLARRVRP